MTEIILMADARVAGVPVCECGEPLVDVREFLLVDRRSQDDSDGYFYLRRGVFERLRQAEAALPLGMRFLVVEGYRPLAVQRRYFDDYARGLRVEHGDWTDGQVRAAASRFVSPVEIAPHSAGAAVDLTLVDDGGSKLDLGTPMNASPEESGGRCYTAASGIGDAARELREVMGAALASAGLVNYPTEWWHWSFGDRYWALITGAERACYAALELEVG
ncbi:M15 family metallopeptidase [Actinomadura litoris]|uniref:M15 family metallopeptidase n=1 Tax=Actinomadura litoris TaxID=2678616 RepID=UPI001FA7FAD7|nr:M15 family metallopeptidase [Actinomadura litoris]